MHFNIDFPPQTEAWINTEARLRGLLPADLIRRVVEEHAAVVAREPITADQDATIALMQSWIDEDATDDPEQIREAEADLREFKRNMNAPRREAGERLLFPEVE